MSTVHAPALAWLNSMEEATRQSRERGKPVFLDLYSTTCGGCKAMETVTYPDHEVQEFLGDHFIPARLEARQAPETARRYNQIWTPTLLVLNEEGVENHRVVGFLPPEELRAELSLGLAKAYLSRGALENALVHFRETVNHFTESWAAPEAQYWLGVTRYRAEGDAAGLKSEWNILMEGWPESRWARSASFLRVCE